MNRTLPLLAIAFLGIAPPLAQAAPGQLDRSFGRQGRVQVPFPSAPVDPLDYVQKPPTARMAMAPLTNGKIAAATSRFVSLRRSNGGADRSFGNRGRAGIQAPSEWQFELADLAGDLQGRILVAGTLASLTVSRTQDPVWYREGKYAHGPRPRYAVVYRYLPEDRWIGVSTRTGC